MNASVTTVNEIEEISSSLLLASSGIKKCITPINVNGISTQALIDTGSSASFIDEEVVKQYGFSTNSWNQEVSMASSIHTSKITEICPATLTLNNKVIPEVLFRVMKNLCCNVILGHDVLGKYSTLEIEFGGSMPTLKLFALKEVNIDPVDLFPNMSSECKPIAIKSRRYAPNDQKFIENEIKTLLADESLKKAAHRGVLKYS